MRIALNLIAVHIGSRIALIGIADDIFLVGLLLVHDLPFHTRGEAGTTAAAQLRRCHLMDNGRRLITGKDRSEGIITAHSDIIEDLLRVNKAGMT